MPTIISSLPESPLLLLVSHFFVMNIPFYAFFQTFQAFVTLNLTFDVFGERASPSVLSNTQRKGLMHSNFAPICQGTFHILELAVVFLLYYAIETLPTFAKI